MSLLNHTRSFHLIAAFFVVTLLIGASVSYAQVHTLTIRSGQVYLNGKLQSPEDIPRSLRQKSVDVNLRFDGVTDPVFDLYGSQYKIKNNRLVDVTPSENEEEDDYFRDEAASDNNTTVIFRNNAAEAKEAQRSNARYANPSASASKKTAASNPNTAMQQHVMELNNHAQQLNNMRGSIPQQQAQDLIQQVQYQAEQAAQLAQDLPYLQLQNYFAQVRASDEKLYNRLVNELEMERQTIVLSSEIRQLPAGDLRTHKIGQLRELLTNILELKQENRLQEIEQLEKQLSILKERFAYREAKKDQLVDRRINQLIANPR